jgi:drug/metabolite transporter (DMT)-like permease
MAIILAGLSAILYGAADFSGGLASRRSPVYAVVVISQVFGLLLAVPAALLIGVPVPSWQDFAWGAAAGLCGAVGIAILYAALATTVVAVVSPVAAVVGTAIPVLLGVAGGDRPGTLAWIGIALALPAIVLLGAGPVHADGRGTVRRALWMGAAAGVGFGLFFAAISRSSAGSGLWPLLSARAASILTVLCFALATRRPLGLAAGRLPLVAAAGLLDMGANITFLLASRSGMLTIAAVVCSLYPGPTVLLARLVLREKLSWPRIAGLALALGGVALISAGG